MADQTIAIIGAGGIGSHFCRILHRLLNAQQLGATLEPGQFTVYDFDVVEPKNVKWQDYDMQEIGVPKAMLMTLRYGYKARVKRFVEDDLGHHPRYIIAADNAKVRALVFNHVNQVRAGTKHFVDMRSEGDVYAVFTDTCPLKTLMESLGADTDSTVGASCQRAGDQERNVVQLGNWFAAVAGMDALLRQFRNTKCPESIVRTII